jgi:hypothetical protein
VFAAAAECDGEPHGVDDEYAGELSGIERARPGEAGGTVMAEPLVCHRCGLKFASAVEESALKKLEKKNEELARILRLKRCHCPSRLAPTFTSSVQPPDLNWYDKFRK